MTRTQPVIYTQRIREHKSAIGTHMEKHGLTKSALEDKQFAILKKKADRDLIVQFLPELLFIKELSRLFYSPLS